MCSSDLFEIEEQWRSLSRLGKPFVIERDVGMSLETIRKIPISLTVTPENDSLAHYNFRFISRSI